MAAEMNDFTVIAHRGHSADRPENTFLAFERALEQGFTHIEMDVQLSSDGIALVSPTTLQPIQPTQPTSPPRPTLPSLAPNRGPMDLVYRGGLMRTLSKSIYAISV